jgi:hypothetical protein
MNKMIENRYFFRQKWHVLVAVVIFVASTTSLSASTSIVFTGAGPYSITVGNQQPIIDQFQGKADINGPSYANAFAFGNTLGYSIGRATLGDFPHFSAGFSLNAGLSNMENFQHSKSGVYKGTLPGLGLAPAFHLGVGLGGGFDFIGKLFVYNLDLYNPNIKTASLELDKLSLYSIGGRVRYNVITEKKIIPFLFSFGGITLVAGGDISRGIVEANGKYSLPFSQITVAGFGVANPTLDGTYNASVTWYQMSGTAQALAYFQIFGILSMYTGGGLTIGYGWFTLGFDASGSLSDSGTTFGTLSCTSKSKYHPYSILPTYIVGFEIDIPLVKIVTESQVNLRNRTDVSVSLGVRVQI